MHYVERLRRLGLMGFNSCGVRDDLIGVFRNQDSL